MEHLSADHRRVFGNRDPFGCALVGESCFLVLMLSCCAIQPSWFAVKRGLSFYGNSAATIVPYSVGFGASIALTALALSRLQPRSVAARRFRYAVGGILVLTAAVPLTPYAVDVVFDWLHTAVVGVLFCAGLALGGWIVARQRDRATVAFYLVELAAAVSIATALVGLNPYMIPSELVFQGAAFALVAWRMRRLVSHSHAKLRSALPQVHPPGVVLTERGRHDRHAVREVEDRVPVERRAVVMGERSPLVRASAVCRQQIGGSKDRVVRIVDVAPIPYLRQVAGSNCIGPCASARAVVRARPKSLSTKLIAASSSQRIPNLSSASR